MRLLPFYLSAVAAAIIGAALSLALYQGTAKAAVGVHIDYYPASYWSQNGQWPWYWCFGYGSEGDGWHGNGKAADIFADPVASCNSTWAQGSLAFVIWTDSGSPHYVADTETFWYSVYDPNYDANCQITEVHLAEYVSREYHGFVKYVHTTWVPHEYRSIWASTSQTSYWWGIGETVLDGCGVGYHHHQESNETGIYFEFDPFLPPNTVYPWQPLFAWGYYE